MGERERLVNGGSGGGGRPSDSPASSRSATSDVQGYWKQHLLRLQESAPTPRSVPCPTTMSHRPAQYDAEFHGPLAREESERLLADVGEGAFLVRESQRSPGAFTLCMRFDERTLNYKLFFDGQHFVGEKRFESMHDLVADGLICMYMDKHAADYIRRMTDEAIYDESPYNRFQQLYDSSSQAQPSRTAASTQTARPARKAHRFKAHTFGLANYCDFCGNFMWGLVMQGARCEDCGFAAHRKCSERARLDCRPDVKYVRRVFAVDLTTLCMAHGARVPPIVTWCVAEVSTRGLRVEGVYRVSGSHDDIERLRVAVDTNARFDPSRLRAEDIHTISGLLKLYLRLLPLPLITFSVARDLLNAFRQSRCEYERVKQMRRAVADLPPMHAATLATLLQHLQAVAAACTHNRMTVENLATVFAPTLLCHSSPQNVLTLPQQEQALLRFLLVQNQQVFA